jgi:hypothetical protein
MALPEIRRAPARARIDAWFFRHFQSLSHGTAVASAWR